MCWGWWGGGGGGGGGVEWLARGRVYGIGGVGGRHSVKASPAGPPQHAGVDGLAEGNQLAINRYVLYRLLPLSCNCLSIVM